MKTILTSLIAIVLATCSISNASDMSSEQGSKDKSPAHPMMQVSHEGYAAMRAIRAARIAIFDGNPTLASEMLVKANNDLEVVAKDPTTYAIRAEAVADGKSIVDDAVKMKPNLIPIDGQIAMGDNYVVSTTNASHVKKANEHLHHGMSKEAIEELRLADIEVSFSRVMMPLSGTMAKVAQAMTQIQEHQYYEANLTLKSAEHALSVDTISIIESPKMKPTKKAK